MGFKKRTTFLINVAYFAVIVAMTYITLRYVLPLMAPFVIGFFIAYILRRPVRLLRDRLGLPEKLAAILTVLLFYGTVGALLVLISIKAASALFSVITMLPTMYETHALPFFTDILKNVEGVLLTMDPVLVEYLDGLGTDLIYSLGNMVTGISVSFMGFATGVAAAIPALFLKLVLMIISTFFIAADFNRLTSFCLRQMSDNAYEVFLQIKTYLVGTLWVCIRSYILIMSLTFVELSICLTVIRIEHAVLIAFFTAIFDILPVLGTGGIMIPWALLTLIQGNYSMALGLGLTYLAITVIRNILEPKIVGSQLGLHPVVTLCSMFTGVQLFGIVGLFGFPILLSLLRYLNDHGVIKIFK